jgi:hypothetical protein
VISIDGSKKLEFATRDSPAPEIDEYLTHLEHDEDLVDYDDDHEDICKRCGIDDGRVVILCDKCPGVMHLECNDPPLPSVPVGIYICPLCSKEQFHGYDSDEGFVVDDAEEIEAEQIDDGLPDSEEEFFELKRQRVKYRRVVDEEDEENEDDENSENDDKVIKKEPPSESGPAEALVRPHIHNIENYTDVFAKFKCIED